MNNINIFLTFGAGFLSFISPCTLPLYPAFLSYITGMSVKEIQSENGMLQKRSMLHTTFFLLGFSIVFIAIGFTTSAIGEIFNNYSELIRQIGAIFIVLFGLIVVGIIKPPFLMSNHKIEFKNRPTGYFGTFIIGIAFGAGWTPCTGPILGSVILLAGANPSYGVFYMITYTLGFAIPFFILSFFVGKLKWIRRYSHKIMTLAGYLMIIMGIILYFDWMTYIISYLTPLFGDFIGF